ncbi:MAG: hypothetical protein GY745_09990 [Actinomycetia bacterium]|nr:hypothetical protein [Actinomycetes bacterium]
MTVVLVAALVVGNVLLSSNGVFVNRDPGVYETTGRWLADDGGLVLEHNSGPFREAGLRDTGAGYQPANIGGPGLYPQFAPLTAVFAALGWWVAGPHFLFGSTAVLAGVALMVFALLVGRRLGMAWAFLATLVLGTNAIFVYGSRETLSEIPMLLMLLVGLLLVGDAERRADLRLFALGGLTIGFTTLARIDGLALMIPLVLTVVILSIEPGVVAGRSLIAASSGLVGAGLGVLVLRLRSPWYLESLWPQTSRLLWAIGVAVCVAIGCRAASRRGWLVSVRWNRVLQAPLQVGAVAAPLLVLWALTGRVVMARPIAPEAPSAVHGALAALWISWWTGPFLLVAGALGWAGECRSLRIGPRKLETVLTAFIVVSVAALYLWQPSIRHDQLWGARRFIPVVLPGFVAYAVSLAAASHRQLWHRWYGPPATSMLIAAILLPSLATSFQVRDQRSQIGAHAVVEEMCTALPSGSAVLIAEGQLFHLLLPQTLQTFCGVDVATTRLVGREEVSLVGQLAKDWDARGRRLFIVSANPRPLGDDSGLLPIEQINYIPYSLETTTGRRPQSMDIDERVVKSPDQVMRIYIHEATADVD